MLQLEVTRCNLKYCLGMCLRNTATKPSYIWVLTAVGYWHMVWLAQMSLYAHV
jgi:hypothetical protein